MDDVWPIILMGVGGFLIGGIFAMAKAKRVIAAVVVAVLAVLALAGAAAWWVPQA